MNKCNIYLLLLFNIMVYISFLNKDWRNISTQRQNKCYFWIWDYI